MPYLRGHQLRSVDIDTAERHTDGELPNHVQSDLQPLDTCGEATIYKRATVELSNIEDKKMLLKKAYSFKAKIYMYKLRMYCEAM